MPDLEKFRAKVAAGLRPGAHLLLVHYRRGTNYPLTADQVHDTFLAWGGQKWHSLGASATEGYRLDLLERAPE